MQSDVFTYECENFPPDAGWIDLDEICYPDQWLEGGSLFHHVDPCPGFAPPHGQQFDYQRSLADFAGAPEFFIEWRVETDGHSSDFIGVAPACVSASGFSGVLYHATIARDQVRLLRDIGLPLLFVDITEGVPHTYRVEIYGADLYKWFIDGVLIDLGVPEGAYPGEYSVINWRTKSWYFPNETKWDYIRYGAIPQPGSGDFDSDGTVDEDDLYFFLDCLLGPDAWGPGCRFADMSFDGIADGQDIGLFVEAMLSP